MKKTYKPSLDFIFDKISDNACVESFDNDKYCGIEIKWSMKGYGFGQLLLTYDKKKKEWKSDTEMCSQETLEKILHIAAPKLAKFMIGVDK